MRQQPTRPAFRRYFEPGVGWIVDYRGPDYDECEMVGTDPRNQRRINTALTELGL